MSVVQIHTTRSRALIALAWVLLIAYFGLVALSTRRQLSYEEPTPEPWVITGADVLLPKGDGFRIVSGYMVQGRGDRIEAIGTAEDSPPVPANAVRIDGSGATLLQGLMDAWCHVTDPSDLDRALSSGVTTLRVMDSPSWLSRVLSQRKFDGIVTPRCLYFGADLRRHVKRTELGEGLSNEKLRSRIQRDIIRQVRQGVDGFTLGHDAPTALLDLVTGAPDRYRLPLAVRSPGKIPFGKALHAGDAIGSLEAFFGDWLALDKSERKPRPLPSRGELGRRVDQAVAAERVVLTGLIEFIRATRLVSLKEELRATDIVRNRYDALTANQLIVPAAVLASLPPLTRSRWSQAAHQMRRSLPRSFLESMRSAMPLLATIVKRLIAAEAPLVVATGAGAPFVPMGSAVIEEIELLREIGMDPAESIASATTHSAELMGLENAGSLAPGSRADLLLVEGNPLEDVEALRRVRAVAVAGKWTTAEELDARQKAIQPVFDHEVEFVTTAVIGSIGGTPEDFDARLKDYVERFGLKVRRETVESLRDAYMTADVFRPKHAKVLTAFVKKHWVDD